jgi:hypothetical protein
MAGPERDHLIASNDKNTPTIKVIFLARMRELTPELPCAAAVGALPPACLRPETGL